MDEQNATPLVIAFFFVIRCLVPLIIMLGISFILKKAGLISDTPKRPEEHREDNAGSQNGNGGFAHA